MRYYEIKILNDDGSDFAVYTSFVNGQTDPGALHMELDIIAAAYATPVGGSFVRIWGIPLTVISQAKDFNGKKIKVYGGMKKGLPLANPDQAGLLAQGQIMQGFGNWIGTNMSLDLILLADIGTVEAPKNITFNWTAGTPMSEAIETALTGAFPDKTVSGSVSDALIQDHDEHGFYGTLPQFASWVKQKSAAIVNDPDYSGVEITENGGDIRVYDGPTGADPKQIAFNDLIGQPTWIEPLVIQVSCMMRADIAVGDVIKLPPAQVTTAPQSLSQYRDASVFQGLFQVRQVRHVGSFRQPDAAAWITVIDAYPTLTEATA